MSSFLQMFVHTINIEYFVGLLFPMKYLLSLVVLFNFAFAEAQNYWQPVLQEPTEDIENRRFIPEAYQLYSLDLDGLRQQLVNTPMRFTTQHSTVVLSMPDAGGGFKDFEIFETQMMEQPLYDKYAQIRTYIGFNVTDSANVIRFSITPHGFHNIEFIPGAPTIYTDPFTKNHDTYIIYDRAAMPEIKEDFQCFTDETAVVGAGYSATTSIPKATDDSTLRTYRIAISCNAEYGNIFAGTGTVAQQRANIQAQQVLTMNRVNGVYERDLAITLIFVANNDVLLYFGDPTLDPYDFNFNSRTQDLIDGNLTGLGFPGIGDANYDVGHNFNNISGGNAGCIGCVCSSGQKGSGMTGLSNPTGDPFDIDYVSHEIGHQFGGFHSMASSGCRSGSGQTEAEPGSGSTIMAYAGICSPNVQNNSDDYFHYVNVRDISANIQSGVSSSCAVLTNVSITAPTADAGADYIIPYSTAFILTGSASNLGSNTVTYNWEQNDPENPGSSTGPDPTRTQGPMYRSKPAITVPTRYFPPLEDVVQGNLTPQFEVTPAVARAMEFVFTVRKYNANVGQNDTDLMDIIVDGNAGPFAVTSQNSNISYNTGEAVVVNWDVAGTDASPINTSQVDILLSTDGGLTFNEILATATANDGAETIIIPVTLNASAQARIMVRALGNVYYAVNAADFTITSDEFSLSTNELSQEICLPGDAVYDFTYRTFNGFSTPTALSITGAPAGANVVITPATVINDNTPVNLTISGLTAAMIGSYNLSFEGMAGTTMRTTTLTLEILDSGLATATLLEPLDNAVEVALLPTFEWNVTPGAQEYDIEISTDSSFVSMVTSLTSTLNIFTIPTTLDEDTLYYWRVKNRNVCGEGNFSAVRSFRTANVICLNEVPLIVPVTISSGPPSSEDSIISIINDITITSISLNIDISHTWMGDVDIYLTSPSGTQITIIEDRCGFRNDMIATFSDDGNAINCSFSSPTISGVVLPVDMFSMFNGENALGDWTLTVADDTDQDGGVLNSWSIDICGTQTLSSNDISLNDISLFPNPATDFVTLEMGDSAFAKAEYQVYDLSGRFITSQKIEAQQTRIDISQWATGMYMVKMSLDDQTIVKRLIKE